MSRRSILALPAAAAAADRARGARRGRGAGAVEEPRIRARRPGRGQGHAVCDARQVRRAPPLGRRPAPRRAQDPGSADGALIESHISRGAIVPVEITLRLLRNAMRAARRRRRRDRAVAAAATRPFLVDGFPRNAGNLRGWDGAMPAPASVEAVLFYENLRHGMRLLGAKTGGRADDAVDVIRKRFKTYVDETMPIIQHYDAGGAVPSSASTARRSRRRVCDCARSRADLRGGRARANAELLAAIDAGTTRRTRGCATRSRCFEPEADGQLVEGLEFHRFFPPETTPPPRRALSPLNRLLYAAPPSRPDAAARRRAARRSPRHAQTAHARCRAVTCSRVMQARDADGARPESVQETRIWQRYPGALAQHYMHRSAVSARARGIAEEEGARASATAPVLAAIAQMPAQRWSRAAGISRHNEHACSARGARSERRRLDRRAGGDDSRS